MKPAFVRRQQAVSALVLAVLAMAAVACSDDDATGSSLPECSSSVNLTVTGGNQPVFSWTPECRLFSVGVELTSTGEDQWLVVSESGENTIAPGVRYGQTPEGATQAIAPRNLIPGETYIVVAISVVSNIQGLAGSAEFGLNAAP